MASRRTGAAAKKSTILFFPGCLTLSPRCESLRRRARWHARVLTMHYPKRSGRARLGRAAQLSPSIVRAPMRIRGEHSGMRRRPASTVKAARLRKYDELGRLRVYDDLGGLNVDDSLWRRITSLNHRRFFNHLRVGWGNCGDGTVPRTGADITARSDLLIVQLGRESPVPLHCFG